MFTASPRNFYFLFKHPAHSIALGMGTGLSPWAPGTAGTLLGWLLYALCSPFMAWSLAFKLFMAVMGFFVGWWACTLTAKHLNKPDPGCIVWDEIWAFVVLLFVCTQSAWLQKTPWPEWAWQSLAFLLFRFFDALKPFPVSWADQKFKGMGPRGGFGVMFDDAVAALCVYLVLWGLYSAVGF
jgi:phosphatidylglycerophosphatase A